MALPVAVVEVALGVAPNQRKNMAAVVNATLGRPSQPQLSHTTVPAPLTPWTGASITELTVADYCRVWGGDTIP